GGHARRRAAAQARARRDRAPEARPGRQARGLVPAADTFGVGVRRARMAPASSTTSAGTDLAAAHGAIRREAVRLAGGPGDIPPRVALHHAIFLDSGGNHCFPEVALHG